VEIWDTYTVDRQKTGKTIVRGKTLSEGEFHLVVHMWIMNRKGEFLIRKRAASVESSPNIWAITGGAAVAGDDSFTACKREVYEELGIHADMNNAKVAFTSVRNSSICDTWIIHQDFVLSDCKLQKEEVSEVRWATKDAIRLLEKDKEFHH
jgi:8-oxo-dGTP diphosphatase